ncbi:MAG: MMPL family transporter [Hahellaceae bacterium]|nr:MMPL family transporter [Hahellaceae bacterium]MCP5213124.1 MMPL family transporter [Hahellaceae bacterium]
MLTTGQISKILVDKSLFFFLASLALIAALVTGAGNLYFESDYKIFFDKNNPQLLEQDEIEDTYTKSDNITLVVSTSAKDLFNEKDLSTLLDITDHAWTLPYSIRVDSLTNFQNTYAEGDDLVVENLVPDTLSNIDLDQLKKTALSQIELVDFVLSADAKTTSITILLQLPDDKFEKDAATYKAISAARELISKVESERPELKLFLLGQTTVNVTFNELSQRDSGLWFPIMFLIMAVLLIVLLRSVSGMFCTLVIIATSVASTLGTMGWFGLPLNQITAALPVIILTLAVCDCVHILNNYYFHLADNQDKATALSNSLTTNFQPVFLTSFTTVIGFLSMNFSDTPPLRDLGNWAAVGVTFAYIFSLTVLPFIALKLPAKGRKQAHSDWSDRYTHWLLSNKKSLLIGFVLVVVGLLSQIPKNELNDNTIGYFKQSVPFRQAADFMQENLTGFDMFSYSLTCNETNCVNDPAFLNNVQTFVDWLEKQPEIVHVVSYTDIIKRLNRNMHNGDEKFYTIPDTRELAAQYQLLYELSLPFGLDLNNIVNVDKSALKISAIIKGQKAQQLLEIEDRAGAWLQANHPDLHSHGTGISIMFAHLGQRNIYSMISGSLIALVLVTLTLMIALRSVKYGLISLIPNSLPAAAAFGVWGMLMSEVNVAVAVVFSFTLGIIVDDTVHFLTKYLRGINELGKNSLESVSYALSVVGKSIVITTVVLAAGFSVLALSDFNVNAYMGAMVALTIVIALVLDLVLLPLILMKR